MPTNDFCDNFLIECLNKIALLDNTYKLMGHFNVYLLNSHTNNVTLKFLEVMTSCFCFPYIQQPTRVVGSCTTFIGNIFMNSLELCQLDDHLLKFLVLKDFRVSYESKHEQIFKRNYTFLVTMNLKMKLTK